MDVLETMERNGVQPDEVTYGTLMKACEGEGAFSIMRSLMDEMDQRGGWVGACVSVCVRALIGSARPHSPGANEIQPSVSVSVSVSAAEGRKKSRL